MDTMKQRLERVCTFCDNSFEDLLIEDQQGNFGRSPAFTDAVLARPCNSITIEQKTVLKDFLLMTEDEFMSLWEYTL